MIVVRNIFQVKFGQTKEATAIWKKLIAVNQRLGYGKTGTRLLTDLAGPPYYTLILESTFDSLADWERASLAIKDNTEWRDLYEKVVPLTDSGRREILSVLA